MEGHYVGWYCSYTPLEIISAAGLTPYRLLPESSNPTHCLSTNTCVVARRLVQAVLDSCPPLSGVIIVNSCNTMAHAFEALKRHYGEDKFVYLLDLPRKNSPESASYYSAVLRRLAARIAGYFHTKITELALHAAEEAYRRQSHILSRLYVQRRNYPSTLPGSSLARVAIEYGRINPLQNRHILEDNLVNADMTPRPVRILVAGSAASLDFLDAIEEAGLALVSSDLCLESRSFAFDQRENTEDEDVFLRLAKKYLSRTPCPRMFGEGARLKHLLDKARTDRVDGVLYHTAKFCDPFLYEYPLVQRVFDRWGIPVLKVETDLSSLSRGQIRTRLEAFREILSAKAGAEIPASR